MSQPNILFVMADQLSALALPMYGHPVVKTPALSALADRGLVFENAYCNFPLCGPSRQSMMCGKLPSRCGAYDNATMLASDQPTFAHYLASAGYKTCLSGKMHFVGPNQMHGFGERLTTDVYPADFGWTPDWTADPSTATFQDTRNVFETGPCARSMQLDYDEDTAYQAERWLFDQARKDGPWMLTVSFTHPHDPYQATPEFWDLYDDSDIDLPALGFEDVETDAHSARIRSHYSIDQAKVDDNTLRRMRHGYYAAISYIDAKVARLVQVLEQSGMDKNTIIIFTSDHGDMMGERGLFYKKSFWEWSARVPMIVAGPGIKPGRKSQPVSLIDLLPTFCEIADVQPLDADGQSLLS
ncbi:MAG: choline-sulfatase, partial [Planktomarina sp.]